MRKLISSSVQKSLLVILFVGICTAYTTTTQAVSLTVTNNMLFHFKVDKGTLDESGNPATNGVDVQTWQDLSGNGKDISVHTSTTRRPTYVTNIASNGMPGLYFDGANDMLYCSPLDLGTVIINTLFLVFSPTNDINNSSTPAQVIMN